MKAQMYKAVARIGALALMGLLGLGLAAREAAAQPRGTQPPPVAGSWCGLADNGVVRMSVSADSRFVESIEISTDRGSLSSQEGTVVVPRAQIADEKFIFRGGETQRDRCEPQRCSGPNCPPRGSNQRPGGGGRNECENYPNTGIMIRGSFLSPEYVRGSYTGQMTEILSGDPNNPSRGPVRTKTRRVVGTYIAWPVGVAPCP